MVLGLKLLSGMLIAFSWAWKSNFNMTGGRVEKIRSSQYTVARKRVALWSVILSGLVAAFLMLEPPRAHATLALQLSDGSTTVTIFDGGAFDQNPLAGAVTYLGTVGLWSLNLSTVLGIPVVGTLALPTLHLDSVNVSSPGAGTLSIWGSQSDYTGLLSGNFLLESGGWTSGTVGVNAYLSTTNTLFGTSTLLGSLGLFTNGAFSGATAGPVAAGGSYALTLGTSITHSGPGVTSLNVNSVLPEPASLILLGSGLLVLGLVSRRKRFE